MTLELLLRYLHFICIFIVVATLAAEITLLKKQMTRAELARLSRIDGIYGLAAMSLIAVGLTLWLGGHGKPTAFYSKNWIFHLKIGLFLSVGLLSIKPTVFFIRQRKGNPGDIVDIPASVPNLIRAELFLLVIIPLLAGLMSRGVGYHP